MIRFHAGSAKLGRDGDAGQVAFELNRMTDFLQVSNADAAHLLAAMDFSPDTAERGLPVERVTMMATRILRMIQLGEGKEFGRSPAGATDDGMSPTEVEAALNELALLAVRAQLRGRAVVAVLAFDDDMIARPND